MRRLMGTVLLGLAMAFPGPGVQSHPHVWVTGGADFGLDDEGRLARLHVTWVYDQFASLYLVNYLEVDTDRDGVFSDEDKAKVLADQTNWPDTFQGDSYLFVNGQKQKLGKPLAADTRILPNGQVEVTFIRELAEPFRPGGESPEAMVKVYDPTFYYAYEVSEAPKIIAAEGHGCTSVLRRVDPNDDDLNRLRVELSAIPRDGTPEQADVGALFADEMVLTCD